MEINKNYVCLLDQSKRLSELGVKKDSMFVWLDGGAPKGTQLQYFKDFSRVMVAALKINLFPAYTLQELYEIMADLHETKGYKIFNDWFSAYATNYDPRCVAEFIIKKLEKINGN